MGEYVAVLGVADEADGLGAEGFGDAAVGRLIVPADESPCAEERTASVPAQPYAARSIASTISLRASAASPQRMIFTHLPGSRSL